MHTPVSYGSAQEDNARNRLLHGMYLSLARDSFLNNRTVIGVEWGGWVMRYPEENRELVAEVVAAIAAGDLHPVAPVERPLDDAAAALLDLLERRAVGKIVLVP